MVRGRALAWPVRRRARAEAAAPALPAGEARQRASWVPGGRAGHCGERALIAPFCPRSRLVSNQGRSRDRSSTVPPCRPLIPVRWPSRSRPSIHHCPWIITPHAPPKLAILVPYHPTRHAIVCLPTRAHPSRLQLQGRRRSPLYFDLSPTAASLSSTHPVKRSLTTVISSSPPPPLSRPSLVPS